ncbi:hypothetical protein GGR52DRAFT_252079 [Hypoxylon sp. FL1284]|nr:hypothetical protein GGR52DRAFT_252079 [Hypoxylon sp. FL1284]
MAESPDSRFNPFRATPTASGPSTVSDISSLRSDSIPSTLSNQSHSERNQNQSTLSDFASGSQATPSVLSDPTLPHLDGSELSDWSLDADPSYLANHYEHYDDNSSGLFVDDLDMSSDYEYDDVFVMDQGNESDQIDELVGVEVQELDNPQNRQAHERHQTRPEPEVIDLTGENSPDRAAFNVRLRRPQRSPPRPSRGDNNYVGGHTVIDLVSDSDDEPEAAGIPPLRRSDRPRVPRRENNAPPHRAEAEQRPSLNHPMLRNYQHISRLLSQNIPFLQLFNNGQGRRVVDDDVIMLNQRPILPADNNVGQPERVPPAAMFPPVQLNYNAIPFGNVPHAPGNPKPPHEPPKDTRQGFTRNTAPDLVAICPSCEQELAYEEGDDGTPSKRGRTKKDKAEHHFWAVKSCGHVYCRKCFDNRKPVGKNPVPVGFRPDPSGAKNKMLCAVEDCDSEVGSKTAWVGIFM